MYEKEKDWLLAQASHCFVCGHLSQEVYSDPLAFLRSFFVMYFVMTSRAVFVFSFHCAQFFVPRALWHTVNL